MHYKVKTAEVKQSAALDFRQFLHNPLCPMPLSTCIVDGTRRCSNKSKLKKVLLIRVGSLEKSVLVSFPKDVLLIDLIALINTMIFELPSTCEEFAKKVMQSIPQNYKRVDFLADNYKNKTSSLNPFVPNVPFLYPLKTSENFMVF